jgi:deazaflavin-dependent oxidoreductase (nitroreductase family)
VEDDLVAWGRVLRIETIGRVTGRPARATVGFVERDAGVVAVAAGSPDADWGRNLLANAACRCTVGETSWAATARPLDGPGHARAVRDLILKYGTPAESLGSGPAFELVPLDRGVEGPSGT